MDPPSRSPGLPLVDGSPRFAHSTNCFSVTGRRRSRRRRQVPMMPGDPHRGEHCKTACTVLRIAPQLIMLFSDAVRDARCIAQLAVEVSGSALRVRIATVSDGYA